LRSKRLVRRPLEPAAGPADPRQDGPGRSPAPGDRARGARLDAQFPGTVLALTPSTERKRGRGAGSLITPRSRTNRSVWYRSASVFRRGSRYERSRNLSRRPDLLGGPRCATGRSSAPSPRSVSIGSSRAGCSPRWPSKGLEMGGLALSDVDEIAIAWNPGIELGNHPRGYLSARRWRTEHLAGPAGSWQLLGTNATDEITIRARPRVARRSRSSTTTTHTSAMRSSRARTTHAASSCSMAAPEKQTSLSGGRGNPRREARRRSRPHSLGLFYGTITQHLASSRTATSGGHGLGSYARATTSTTRCSRTRDRQRRRYVRDGPRSLRVSTLLRPSDVSTSSFGSSGRRARRASRLAKSTRSSRRDAARVRGDGHLDLEAASMRRGGTDKLVVAGGLLS